MPDQGKLTLPRGYRSQLGEPDIIADTQTDLAEGSFERGDVFAGSEGL